MTRSPDVDLLPLFRRTAWRYQQTFRTPLKNLDPFVATILSAIRPLQEGTLIVDQVVFEPKQLLALLARHSFPPDYAPGLSLTVRDELEAETLLRASLSEWIDFLFVPKPRPFVIYADHDEYTTFFSQTRSNLNRVTQALAARRFQMVPDFQRRL